MVRRRGWRRGGGENRASKKCRRGEGPNVVSYSRAVELALKEMLYIRLSSKGHSYIGLSSPIAA